MAKFAFIYDGRKTSSIDMGDSVEVCVKSFISFLVDCGFKEKDIKKEISKSYLSLSHEDVPERKIVMTKIFDCK